MLAKTKPNQPALAGYDPADLQPQVNQPASPRQRIAALVTPEAAARLQLLASSHNVGLEAITNVIRNDHGLTIQTLQCGAKKLGKRAAEVSSLEELIVLLGLDYLRTLAAEAILLVPNQRTH